MTADDRGDGTHDATQDALYEPAAIEERTDIGQPLIGIPSGSG